MLSHHTPPPATTAAAAGTGRAPPTGTHARLPLTCFVVEDSAVIRQNLIATLEEMLPLQVVGWAEDERSAVEWMSGAGPRCDLMLIDIFLKSGTGLEVLRQAKAKLPQSNLVVLTNYATPDMRQRCRHLGADRLYDKSAELEELLAHCAALSQRS